MGRHKYKKAVKNSSIVVYMTLEESIEVKEFAEKEGKTASQAVRELVLEGIRKRSSSSTGQSVRLISERFRVRVTGGAPTGKEWI